MNYIYKIFKSHKRLTFIYKCKSEDAIGYIFKLDNIEGNEVGVWVRKIYDNNGLCKYSFHFMPYLNSQKENYKKENYPNIYKKYFDKFYDLHFQDVECTYELVDEFIKACDSFTSEIKNTK